MTEAEWYFRLGRRLRAERTRRGLTIYDVAALVDVSGVAVSYWERGLRRMKAREYDVLRRSGMVA